MAKVWPEDDNVALVLRGSASPISIDDAPALVALSSALLSALAPQSAAADLLSRGLQLQFGHGAGGVGVPKLVPSAEFVREGQAIAVREASPASAAVLYPRKIKVIVLATWGLLNNPGAEDMLRQMLIESTGPALDAAVLSAAAATSERPAGLLNRIAPLASAGNLTDDLITLLSRIAPVSGNGQVALVASGDKAAAINLLPSRPALRRWSTRRRCRGATSAPGQLPRSAACTRATPRR